MKKTSYFTLKGKWIEKDEPNFDVGMGSFDGAKNCDIVGLYLLSQLQHLGLNIGLYRDDGLATSEMTPQQTDSAKKEICQIFKNNGLKVTIEANITSVNFLDITLDSTTSTFKPFKKQNILPQYVHVNSNHPPNILKNIPLAVNKRLSEISSNKDIFDVASRPYQEALSKSGYKHVLKYESVSDSVNKKKKCRNRRVSWFNPPFCQNVSTNVAKTFFSNI